MIRSLFAYHIILYELAINFCSNIAHEALSFTQCSKTADDLPAAANAAPGPVFTPVLEQLQQLSRSSKHNLRNNRASSSDHCTLPSSGGHISAVAELFIYFSSISFSITATALRSVADWLPVPPSIFHCFLSFPCRLRLLRFVEEGANGAGKEQPTRRRGRSERQQRQQRLRVSLWEPLSLLFSLRQWRR